MAKMSDIALEFEAMNARVDQSNLKSRLRDQDITALTQQIRDVHDRINSTNRAIDAVNARLDDEMAVRFAAITGHSQKQQEQLDRLEQKSLGGDKAPFVSPRVVQWYTNEQGVAADCRRVSARRVEEK